MTFIATGKTIWLGDSVNHNANGSALRLLSVHMYMDIYVMMFMWTLGDNLQCVVSLDQTPVVRLRGNHLYLLSHLSSSPTHKVYSFLFFMFKFILIVLMHVFLCGEPVHLRAGACGSRRILDSLGLDLEVVMSHLRWVLEIRLRSSARDVCALNHGALSSSHL